MKIIEVPATLRLFVNDDVSTEDAKKLAEGMLSNTCGTVSETNLHEDLQEHLSSVDIQGGEAIFEADLWVYETPDEPVIHQC